MISNLPAIVFIAPEENATVKAPVAPFDIRVLPLGILNDASVKVVAVEVAA